MPVWYDAVFFKSHGCSCRLVVTNCGVVIVVSEWQQFSGSWGGVSYTHVHTQAWLCNNLARQHKTEAPCFTSYKVQLRLALLGMFDLIKLWLIKSCIFCIYKICIFPHSTCHCATPVIPLNHQLKQSPNLIPPINVQSIMSCGVSGPKLKLSILKVELCFSVKHMF